VASLTARLPHSGCLCFSMGCQQASLLHRKDTPMAESLPALAAGHRVHSHPGMGCEPACAHRHHQGNPGAYRTAMVPSHTSMGSPRAGSWLCTLPLSSLSSSLSSSSSPSSSSPSSSSSSLSSSSSSSKVPRGHDANLHRLYRDAPRPCRAPNYLSPICACLLKPCHY